MKLKKSDIIILIVFLVVGAGALLLFQMNKSDGSKVKVIVGGEEYEVLDLNKDTTLVIEQKNGSTNTVIVEDGFARMLEASCPDQLCVHQSKIHYDGEMVVCLPNYVVLEVIDGQESTVDSVTN